MKKKMAVLMLLVLLAANIIPVVSIGSEEFVATFVPIEGSDSILPEYRAVSEGVVAEGKIYQIGGRKGSSQTVFTDDVIAYDISTNGWERKASTPVPIHDASATYWNGKIYLFGGISGNNWSVSDVVYEYDIVTDTWNQKTNMPWAGRMVGLAVVDGVIYVTGGIRGDGNSNYLTYVYDPEANTWTQKENMAIAASAQDADDMVHYNGELFYFGNIVRKSSTDPYGNGFQKYNIAEDTWQELAAPPSDVCHDLAYLKNDKIYLVCDTMIYTYDPDADEWIDATPVQEHLWVQVPFVMVDDTIYILGMLFEDEFDNRVHILEWEEVEPTPSPIPPTEEPTASPSPVPPTSEPTSAPSTKPNEGCCKCGEVPPSIPNENGCKCSTTPPSTPACPSCRDMLATEGMRCCSLTANNNNYNDNVNNVTVVNTPTGLTAAFWDSLLEILAMGLPQNSSQTIASAPLASAGTDAGLATYVASPGEEDGVRIVVEKSSVKKGRKLKLTAKGGGAKIKSVKWTTSDKKAVSIVKAKKGKCIVKGVKRRKGAMIKARITFRNGTKKTVSHAVRVK